MNIIRERRKSLGYVGIIRLVFRYLNDNELYNAAKVCRIRCHHLVEKSSDTLYLHLFWENINDKQSWQKIADNEKILRGPICYVETKEAKDSLDSWNEVKQNFIKINEARPCLQMFFTFDKKNENILDKCHCKDQSSISYSIIMETYFRMNEIQEENIIVNIFLPKTYKTTITTYTFIEKTNKNGLYCPEIRFDCGNDLNKVKYLRSVIKPFFNNDAWTKSCMILLGREDDLHYILPAVRVLRIWFSYSNIPIWGGLTDALLVCYYCYNKRFCRIDPKFIFIFINNPDLEAWNIILDENCNEVNEIKEKLINFKKTIKLKIHTIAFMHISFPRYNILGTVDTQIFMDIFPKIHLFSIYGEISFGGTLSVLHEKMRNNKIKNEEGITSIMILTYS